MTPSTQPVTLQTVKVQPRAPRLRINHGYLFVAPALILITLMIVFPVYRVVDMSVHSLNRITGVDTFVGLDNYIAVFSDPVFRTAFVQTFGFIGISCAGHIGLGFLLALLMNSHLNRRVLGFSRSLILMPWAMSPIVVATITQLWAHPLISPIAQVLKGLGWTGTFQPLGNPDTALWFVGTVNIWQYTPFYMLMILVGLQTMDEELYDAAKVDGANTLQRLRFLTWPHVRNVVLTFVLFDLVANAAYFDLIWVTTKGGPVRATEVLATYLYRTAFLSLDWNSSSVVAIVLLVLSIILSAVIVRLMRRD